MSRKELLRAAGAIILALVLALRALPARALATEPNHASAEITNTEEKIEDADDKSKDGALKKDAADASEKDADNAPKNDASGKGASNAPKNDASKKSADNAPKNNTSEKDADDADEETMTQPRIAPSENHDTEIVAVELPVTLENGSAPFDFHLDPQGLIYETDAALYGGGLVEEGATLLFHNTQGAYDFSSQSDDLTLTNFGAQPVNVTIDARIEGLGAIAFSDDPDFTYFDQCAIYLAVFDDDGYETPLDGNDGISYTLTLGKDEAYSFGLTGACNVLADWSDVDERPVVTVTWYVEPAERKDYYNEVLPVDPVEEDDEEELPEIEDEIGEETADKNGTDEIDDADAADVDANEIDKTEDVTDADNADSKTTGASDIPNPSSNATGAASSQSSQMPGAASSNSAGEADGD